MSPKKARPSTPECVSYLQEIGKFPLLAAEEEFALARRWRDQHDRQVADKLVTSHLRLVAKIAMGYRGYGLPLGDLISEGSVGMMRAVKRFNPDLGFRLSTYASCWIRAAIQEYILYNWSLVKLGTTAAQKKLFFNLRRLKGQLQAIEDGDLPPEQVANIARVLNVPEQDVVNMNHRLAAPDYSLNAPVRMDSEGERQDWLVDEGESHETSIADREERLKENPFTLEGLSRQYGISPERVRQIEFRAFKKLQKAMKAQVTKRRLAGQSDAEGCGSCVQSLDRNRSSAFHARGGSHGADRRCKLDPAERFVALLIDG